MSATLKQRVFSGTLWMAAISFGQQILAFFVQIVLARLLTPKDYGVVALVMTIGTFAVIFATAGIATALVQRKDLPRQVIDAAAVITGCVALILGGGIFLASGPISFFYELPEMVFLLRFVALDIFLKVMVSLYDSLLLRDLRYRALSVRTFASVLVQSVVSILLAAHGYGAKSLVIGYLFGSVTLLATAIVATRYVPRSFGDFGEVKGVFCFGFWILLGRMVNQAAVVLDQMVVARVLNAASLGLINVSKNLTGLIPNTILGFAGRVTLPVFSRWQDDIQRIESAYWRGLRLNMMLVFPLCVLVGLFSYQILVLLYGVKWIDGEVLMKIFAVQVAVMSIDAGYTGSVINAIGKPKYGTIIMMTSLFMIPGFVYIGSFWGKNGVAWGMASYGVAFLVINLLILRKLCHFHIVRFPLTMVRFVISVIPMFVVGYFLMSLRAVPRYEVVPAVLSYEWFILAMRLVWCGIICVMVYAATIWFTAKDDFLFLWNGVIDVIRHRN